MSLIWKIAAGIVLGFVMLGALQNYQRRQAVDAWLAEAKRIQADPDPLGFRRIAAAKQQPVTRSVLIDVGQLSSDQSCINGFVLFIDRSVPGAATARSFSENGRPVPCHDRTRQRYAVVPAGAPTQ